MSTGHVLYWIWLSLCLSPGSKASDVLLEHFGESAERIYAASDEEYDTLDLSEEIKAKLRIKTSEEAKRIYFWCKEHSVRLLPYNSPQFPERLRRIGRRPVLLYCKGKELDLNNRLPIAMVGTRRMTSYGQRTAYTMAYDLASAGAIVVSGMALGIDGVCHRGAIDAGGDTVAVLGCGIDIAYPKEHLTLMEEIEAHGMVISEYKPGTHPGKSTFPIRNRIISGLSRGTMIVEADCKSGAMITARTAQTQGRELFALPGMVGEQNSEGTNTLLKEGAVPVTQASDILSEYILLYPTCIFPERIPIYKPEIELTPVAKQPVSSKKSKKEEPKEQRKEIKSISTSHVSETIKPSEDPLEHIRRDRPSGLNDACGQIFDALAEAEEPMNFDGLSLKTGLNVTTVMTSLTILEIKGHVLALPGGRFVLK